MTTRRAFLRTLGGSLLAAPIAAGAQAPAKVPRIGYITTSAPEEQVHLTKAFDEGLRELGYVEGRNVIIERRFAGGKQERLPALAAELAGLKPDVIVTGANPVISAVKQATSTIPVVMAVSRDPVGAGFIRSIARPGGNITGLTNDPTPDIAGKNLELLKEAAPGVSRVALVWNSVPPGARTYRDVVEGSARKLGVAFQSVETRGRSDVEGGYAAMVRERADGVVVLTDPVIFSVRDQIALLGLRNRLPTVTGLREYAEAGSLISYGPNIARQFRRAATYVDKILKGAKPGDLPVEQAAQFELVINLKTAKALGLTIPQSLLQRADEVLQ